MEILSKNGEQIHYAVVDVEVGVSDKKIHDIGACRYDGAIYHKASRDELFGFLDGVEYVCGHNIVHHDAKYLFDDNSLRWVLVDTLYMSPLLFPERPYHRLVKDDKLVSDQVNNPVNDCEKARNLLLDEISKWNMLPTAKQRIFGSLLMGKPEFKGFFQITQTSGLVDDLPNLIRDFYDGSICSNADIGMFVEKYPCELPCADPDFHRQFMKSYNIPEFMRGPVTIKPQTFADVLKGDGEPVKYVNKFNK